MNRVKERMAAITDYTCIFSKHELVGNKVYRENGILLKVKRPGHFYMKWTEGAHKGRVVIYVEGLNNNKMLVYFTGLMRFFPMAFDPMGKEALKENRHPITEADIIIIFNRIIANYTRCQGDVECRPVESTLKDPDTMEFKAEFPPGKGYYAGAVRLFVSRHTWLPTRIVCYDWRNELFEEYGFDNIKINPGLMERDFKKEW